MSFERLRRSWGAVGVRLTAGYVGLLLVTLVLLFGLADWQMRRALTSRDHEAIVSAMDGLERDFGTEGLDALVEEAEERREMASVQVVYVRVIAASGEALFESSWPAGSLENFPTGSVNSSDWFRVSTDDDDELEVATRRLSDDLYLQVAASTAPREEAIETLRETFALIVLPVLVLSFLGGLFAARHVLRPLRDFAAVTRRIADTGIVTDRIPVRGSHDELDELARDFNGMLAHLDRLVRGIRETLDNVAHDLRTPMTTLRGRIELTLRKPDATPEIYQSALEDTLDASGQVVEILNAIMDESEAQSGTLPLRRQYTSLRRIADGVAELYQYVAEDRDIELGVGGDEEITVFVDPARMRQAIANLVDNALKYTPAGGRVDVEIAADDTSALISVHDSGSGIAEVDLPRIWDRLYRADSSRSTRGLGLGLSFVKAIVEAHDGHVSASSQTVGGSRFVVSLPRVADRS
jgi:signal transduction histidine kinase